MNYCGGGNIGAPLVDLVFSPSGSEGPAVRDPLSWWRWHLSSVYCTNIILILSCSYLAKSTWILLPLQNFSHLLIPFELSNSYQILLPVNPPPHLWPMQLTHWVSWNRFAIAIINPPSHHNYRKMSLMQFNRCRYTRSSVVQLTRNNGLFVDIWSTTCPFVKIQHSKCLGEDDLHIYSSIQFISGNSLIISNISVRT